MIAFPWLQISGAVTGGIVGGFSGFIANHIRERQFRRWMQRNVACALSGEIQAIVLHLQTYLLQLDADIESHSENAIAARSIARHRFRGDRDYMPIFRSLGANIAYLPTPLPRDLVCWYTGFGVGLERAHTLHELAIHGSPAALDYLEELTRTQRSVLSDLAASAAPLLDRLARL